VNDSYVFAADTTPVIERLRKRRAVVIADLLCKVDAEDWHGVADAAMDLREIDAQLRVYTS
jgi:hypothetical protein